MAMSPHYHERGVERERERESEREREGEERTVNLLCVCVCVCFFCKLCRVKKSEGER
jgi:hypothetical protein